LASAGLTHVVFGRVIAIGAHPVEFAVFPVVIAAAVIGGPCATTTAVLVASVVAIWHTVHGSGPFASDHVEYSLILLQSFTAVLSGTSLLLAAAIAERRATASRERDAFDVLRQREEMLRLAQRAGGVATFEWNFKEDVANCSAEFFRIFGLPE